MAEMGYPAHIIILLTKLYGKQLARVTVAGAIKSVQSKERGETWCVISPYLFNVRAEVVMREVIKSSQVKYRLLHGRLERIGRPQLTQPQLRPIT